MVSDNDATFIGLVVAFGFPLAVLSAFLAAWIVYTLFTMASPVWIVLYVLFRAFLYITVWVFILTGICWLCGWSGPIHFASDIYSALPHAVYRWFTK